MTDEALLDLAAALAAQAGAVILSVRAAGFAVTAKADRSPVTAADREAEALIVAGLRAATPDIPVIAEEEIAAGIVTAAGREHWQVDPLDGTKEFAAGLDSFAVNVGLVRDGRPVLGAVGVPAEGVVYGGIVGPGGEGRAWKQDATGRHAIHARTPPAAGLTVLASRSHNLSLQVEAALRALGRPVAQVIHLGSAVKFCRIAEGAADYYPRFGPTMEWDTAAPQAVLEAAGGRIVDETGAPLRYGKPGFENPAFFAHGA